jgi:carbon starvation protein
VATTIIVKMSKARYAAVTLVPLVWLVLVTFTASWHKIFDANPSVGFLSHARQLEHGVIDSPTARFIVNDKLDAIVTGVLMVLIALILLESAIQWTRVLSGRAQARVREASFVATRFAAEEQE